MTAVHTAPGPAPGPGRPTPPAAAPVSAAAAVDALLGLTAPHVATAARRAAAVVRDALGEFATVQTALTEALVASQDRLMAVKALTQVDLRDVGGREAIARLLGRALLLTGASTVLLLEQDTVATAAGDLTDLDELTELARQAIAQAPGAPLRAVAGDGVIIGRLDVDAASTWNLAYFRPPGHRFATSDLPLVETIDAALGVVLAVSELHRRELARAAVAREHELASGLAQSAIPDRPPVSDTVDIFARTTPASLTGGDFFTFEHTGEAIWFAVGDISGKGLPAAMFMTRAVAACRVAFLAHRDEPVTAAFRRVEDELFDHLDEAGVFLTLVLGSIRQECGTVSLVNAGHSPVVVVQDGRTQVVRASVPPLGIVRRAPVPKTLRLRGDDCLVIGTDGLVEQEDADEVMFGYDRFDALCHQVHTGPSAQVGERIFAEVAGFAAGRAAGDDATLVVLKHTGTAG